MSGTFVCLDHLGNVMLFDTYCQYHIAGKTLERALNQVIIPQSQLKSAEVLVCSQDPCLRFLVPAVLQSCILARRMPPCSDAVRSLPCVSLVWPRPAHRESVCN